VAKPLRQNAIANAGAVHAAMSGPEVLTATSATTISPTSRDGGRPIAGVLKGP
jgi:hypothetical protein